MAEIDRSKFPLIGIAKFLEGETEDQDKGRRMAKGILHRTVEKSQMATEKDKNEAKVELKELEERMREASLSKLNNVIVMKNPNDLSILEELEKMYISNIDYNLMKENIKEHGVRIPLIITKDNKIVCGRHRWVVAKELGLTEVPTVLLNDDKINEIIRVAISDNTCRRQMTQEERIHYIKLLRELGKSKKGPGRPSKKEKWCNAPLQEKTPTISGTSTRKLAKVLGVDHSTVVRDIQKIEGKKINHEYDNIDKKFHMIFEGSQEKDCDLLNEVHNWIDNTFSSLELEKSNTIDITIKMRVGKNDISGGQLE